MFARLPQVALSEIAPRLKEGQTLEHDSSAKDGFDIKVLLGKDHHIYKFFRIRRFISSNLFSPYARRFARNGQRLIQQNIVAPNVRECLWIPDAKRQVVVYPLIEGTTMRSCLEQASGSLETQTLLLELGRYLARLHDLGICFHAGHLNNYLRLNDSNAFGLIDVTDVFFHRHALKRTLRLNNLRKLAKGKPNQKILQELGWASLLEGYLSETSRSAPRLPPITLKELEFTPDGI